MINKIHLADQAAVRRGSHLVGAPPSALAQPERLWGGRSLHDSKAFGAAAIPFG
jgi:hypothetical protein